MRLTRTLLIVGGIWLVLALTFVLVTPAHYTEVSQTTPGTVSHVGGGITNGGILGVFFSSALSALFVTAFLTLIAVCIGSIAMGIRPFLRLIGLMRLEQNAQ